jgi:hypothetical protein
VHLPREAHWLADYLHDLVIFPRGRYDDQVDSTAQALAWLMQKQSTAGIIEYARMMCEEKKRPVQKMANFGAPIGISIVYTMSGQQVVVPDGMVEVSDENRAPLMAAGFASSPKTEVGANALWRFAK